MSKENSKKIPDFKPGDILSINVNVKEGQKVRQQLFKGTVIARKGSGVGETISDPCSPCKGQGRVNKSKKLSVNVPAGVDNGTRIRLSGEGEAGARGSAPGDLYIFIDQFNLRIDEIEEMLTGNRI